jgi:hypothetical protein
MERLAKTGSSWHVVAAKPAGGYVPICADYLLRAWLAYRQGAISLLDLRVWLACHELVARRCCTDRKLKACYRVEELRPMVGGSLPRLRKAVRSLEATGLLAWQGDSIGLVPMASEDETLIAMREAVQNWRRKVPVPRRVIRFLAGCGRKVMIASVLGHLLRCVYWRDGGCVSGGRCKSSWVADVFGVDYRNVKAARKELVDSGWLRPLASPQTALNRWGLPVVVALDHAWAVDRAYTKSPPPIELSTTRLPPPMNNRELSSRTENQKPGLGRAAGVPMGQAGEPDLRNIAVCDLKEPRRLDGLYRQAVVSGEVADAPAERLRWFAAAERAVELGTRNPCGFFVRLFRLRLWHFITNAQEDAARLKLNRLDNGLCPSSSRKVALPQFRFDASGRLAITVQPMAAMISDALAKSIAA